jgi:hypothetical protein
MSPIPCPIRVRRLPASPAGPQAVEDILNTYPAGNGVEYGLITFQSSVAIQTRDSTGQLGGFTASSDEVKLRLPALNVGVGETNYVGALTPPTRCYSKI